MLFHPGVVMVRLHTSFPLQLGVGMVQHSVFPSQNQGNLCLEQFLPCFMAQERELGPCSRVLIEFESH